jgi:hypothetical protein
MILLYIPLTFEEFKNQTNGFGSALKLNDFGAKALNTPKQYEVIWK